MKKYRKGSLVIIDYKSEKGKRLLAKERHLKGKIFEIKHIYDPNVYGFPIRIVHICKTDPWETPVCEEEIKVIRY